jgi:hypothetical protein
MAKPTLTPEQKEFQKLKRFVQKRFPGAYVTGRIVDGGVQYSVVDGRGVAVVDEDLLLPAATTAKQAWEQAKYCAWFTNMIRKSNTAFDDERMYKKLAKECGE